ncbi:MAG: hypothetical protein Q9213_003665 [Squamulea squamosa]
MQSPIHSKICTESYTIQQSSAPLVRFEVHDLAFKLSNLVTWVLWILYIVLQIYFARSLRQSSPHSTWRSWIVILAEISLTFQDAVTALKIVLGLFSSKETGPRPRYRLTGDVAPSIEVLITCCGEPIDVIIDTAAAIAAQDYPAQYLRVFVLDDGHDQELGLAVARLNTRLTSQKRPPVVYLSRKKVPGVRSYFKAGNLRFGIDESGRLGSSDFLAGLDVDMIPERGWLRRMISHLLLDDKLALANPPQSDPLGQQAEFTMLFGFQEALSDRLGAGMCTGTGYVVRRSALVDIGGWSLAESGEDYMCSAVLGNAGWKIAFIREELQAGLAPGSLRAVVNQRMRWTDACMEVCEHFGYYLPGSAITSQMTALQRAVNILYALRDYSPVTTSLALILLPSAVFPTASSRHTVPYTKNSSYFFSIQILYTGTYLASKINTYIMYNDVGLARVQNHESHQIWASPYMAFRNIISILPSSLRTSTFAVCGATTSAINERSARRRSPLLTRLMSLPIPLHILYALFASSALVLRLLSRNPVIQQVDPVSLLPLAGPLVKLTQCIFKALVPVRYMLFPPTIPERDELVEEDEHGVRRPKWNSLRIMNQGERWAGTRFYARNYALFHTITTIHRFRPEK